MINKNDIVEVEIIDIGINGEGIGKKDGFTVFVNGATIGDIVNAKVIKSKKKFAIAIVDSFVKESEYRVEYKCKHAKLCGGCQIQHLEYNKQLEIKQKKVKDAINRIAEIEDFEMEDIIGMDNPWNYRNKMIFPIRKQNDEVKIGMYRSRSHDVIDIEECLIQKKENMDIVNAVKDYINNFNISVYDEETNEGLMRALYIREGFKTKEKMVCIVINGDEISNVQILVKKLLFIDKSIKGIVLNINKEEGNKILGDKIIKLHGEKYITEYIENVKYEISPLSFFQVNPIQTEKLYAKALEYANAKDKVVWDAYCGTGSISLFLAKEAEKVYGVEIVPAAIKDAKANALLNRINNVEFFVGKAEDIITEERKSDVIVVDPPRKGCDEKLLETMLKIEPSTIVYVSCDPATLARDLKILKEKYNLDKCVAVDMFPHSMHVETVVKMNKIIKK
ncbi:MAG: 23S rRNA (uracil(1939)-C(5))-methyltransferase RlmD [Clostridia bacterium]|jgi:23S rRNA (uracil1939-C5)-methyltransferase|nr:23S rRNA (uracil(1939)-C(5))-methyltransferase RlmD [Clostridia bacterium]